MSRSGYVDDCDDALALGRWRAQVASAIRGKRGQAFLRELAEAMDAMPQKVLIAGELVNDEGDCCTIGVVCKTRGVDVSQIDCEESEQVGAAVGIARQLAAEIEYLNDECCERYEPDPDRPGRWRVRYETPEERWVRMRQWVEKQIADSKTDSQ